MGVSASDPTQSYDQVPSLISLSDSTQLSPAAPALAHRGPPRAAGPGRPAAGLVAVHGLAVSHLGRGPAGLALSDRVPCIAGPGASGCSRLPVTVLRSCLY
jgi:hypothetical protein